MGEVEHSNAMKRQTAGTRRPHTVGLAPAPKIFGSFDQAIVPAKSRSGFELARGRFG